MSRFAFAVPVALVIAFAGGAVAAAPVRAAGAAAAPAGVPGAAASAPSQTIGEHAASDSDDPLRAPECRRALDALRTEEAAFAAEARAGTVRQEHGAHAADAKLAAARKRAASACLARRADVDAPPSRFLVAPLRVAPVTAARAPLPPSPTLPAPVRPPAVPERPYAITSCDAGGCWANDGSRLNRVGPNLVGPHGFCSVQGSLLQCP